MALPSSAIASPTCRITLLQRLPSQCHRHFIGWACPISASFYVRSSTARPFNGPRKLKMQFDDSVKKLSHLVSDSVHSFPWKKAESTAVQQLLVLGQKTLKWFLIAMLILSSSYDFLYSISRNRELLIPLGLFFGCLTADFLKDASQDFFPSKEIGRTWHLRGTSCFFILVKIIAIYFSDRKSFLLHTANGGLMQVLWHWINSSQPEGDHGTNVILDDASTTSTAVRLNLIAF